MGFKQILEKKMRFDKRLIERYVRKGLVTEKEVTDYLNTLEDKALESIPLTLPEESNTDKET